jgi:hypothetical protein
LHQELIKAGAPYHSSKFEGTAEEFFEKAQKAYDKMLEIQQEHKNNCKK